MSTLIERLLKNSTIKETALIGESTIFGKKEMIPTHIPMINVALSGEFDGGFGPGILTLAAPSKHFKTAFALILAAAFQRKYKDGIILFYDSEFGAPPSYFASFGVDMSRVIHTPITNIEEIKFDITKQLSEITKKDKVMIVIDSIGNLASLKEAEDALNEKSVADMSRAKQLKSLFRIITPHLGLKDIPMIVVNHVYMTQELYSKVVVGGGTGSVYSSDAIWVIGRQQEKDAEGLAGYNFVINIEKSRHVIEKSKIPIKVLFEKGIWKWSGIFDLALESGHVQKVNQGWFAIADPETGELLETGKRRQKDIETDEVFLKSLLVDEKFKQFIRDKYKYRDMAPMENE